MYGVILRNLTNNYPQYNNKYTYLSFGNSSLKSLEILGVHSLMFRIFPTMSFFCHLPRQDSPLGVTAILVCNCKSDMLIPLCRERVASPATDSICHLI